MKIPQNNIAGFASEIVNACNESAKERRMRGMGFRNLYLTGSEDGTPQTFQKTNEYIETLSSYLYSPIELRFGVEYYGSATAIERAKGEVATTELHKYIRRSNLDTKIGEAVTWSLVKGKTFIKTLWGRGIEPYIIQPELMGVLREDLETLDEQEAFTQSTYYTTDKFLAFIANHPDKNEIKRKLGGYLNPGKKELEDRTSAMKDVILGGLYPFRSGGTNNGQRGMVNWLGTPAANLSPKTLQNLIRMDETWIWDEERQDWTTIQVVGNNIILEGKDRKRNIFADGAGYEQDGNSENPLKGLHPYKEICPNILDGYFWGRSELCNTGLLQMSINTRIDGINKLLRMQEDPPTFFSGTTGVTQQTYAKLRKPGGYLVDSASNAKAQVLAPELPPGLFDSLHEFIQMFNDVGGFSPVLQGRGDAGVRSQEQADTLVRTSSPRFKKRALIIERQVEALGELCLKMLKAKVATQFTGWIMPRSVRDKLSAMISKLSTSDLDQAPVPGMLPVKFLLSQIPTSARVVVDSHSSSPAFSLETESLLFNLFNAGAVKPERLIEHTNPPGRESLLEDLKRTELERQQFMEENPELFMEQENKKRK